MSAGPGSQPFNNSVNVRIERIEPSFHKLTPLPFTEFGLPSLLFLTCGFDVLFAESLSFTQIKRHLLKGEKSKRKTEWLVAFSMAKGHSRKARHSTPISLTLSLSLVFSTYLFPLLCHQQSWRRERCFSSCFRPHHLNTNPKQRGWDGGAEPRLRDRVWIGYNFLLIMAIGGRRAELLRAPGWWLEIENCLFKFD